MKKEETYSKKKQTLYLIMLIAFGIVIFGGVAYAYYDNDVDYGDDLDFNTTIPKSSVFTSSTTGEIIFNTTPKQIGQYSVNTTYIANQSATVNVDLTSGTDYETTYCYYDIVWSYNSDDKYYESDVALPHQGQDGKTYPYEFSVKINLRAEKDLSGFSWYNENTKANIVNRVMIASASADTATRQTWNIGAYIYNIDAEQPNLFDREMSALIKVENQECYTKYFEENKVYVMVLDEETNKYTQSETIPTIVDGQTPVFDTELSFCVKGGTINNYNASTGTINAAQGDECYAFFSNVASAGGNA